MVFSKTKLTLSEVAFEFFIATALTTGAGPRW